MKRPELPGSHFNVSPLECFAVRNMTSPPVVQGQLFDGGISQVVELLPELAKQRKTKAARIRLLAKTLGIDEGKAKRLYQQAASYRSHLRAYQQYLRCKDFLDWFFSPEGRAELECYRAEMDELFRRAAEVPVRHYVEINHVDQEVARLLDSDFWAAGGYYGPMDWLVDERLITRRQERC